MKVNSRILLAFATCLTLSLLPLAASAADAARAQLGANAISFTALEANGGALLRISGPEGLTFEREFAPGANPSVLLSELGDYAADGTYNWELVLYPRVSDAVRAEMRQARAEDLQVAVAPEAGRAQGYFNVHGGAIVSNELNEEGGFQASVEAASTPTAFSEAMQVFTTDLIVQGSTCTGIDCVSSESFGFDTLRLKENNLRIHFNDTSASASFPSNDWRLTANDSSNGGANRFSIDDATAGTTPFNIEAGAGNNALQIDSSGGNIGMGTATPVVELHIADGDSPTLRLEQNGASGFTPQTWDIAGNETNFFVRDVTNGSNLPFKIRPGADDNTLVLDNDDNVGIGILDATAKLHVRVNGQEPALLIDEVSTSAGNQIALQAKNAGGNVQTSFISDSGQANEAEWRQNFQTTQMTIQQQGNATGTEFTLTETGDLTIAGVLFANGGANQFPDYVFEPDYALMPLDELRRFVTTNKHLPNIPSAADVKETGGTINMTELQRLLLEKVEELTLYTLSLAEENAELKQRLENLESQTP